MIEWNRVTWYSRLLALSMLAVVFLIGFHLGGEYGNIKGMDNIQPSIPNQRSIMRQEGAQVSVPANGDRYLVDGQEVSKTEFDSVKMRLTIDSGERSEGELPGGRGYTELYPAMDTSTGEHYSYERTVSQRDDGKEQVTYAIRKVTNE